MVMIATPVITWLLDAPLWVLPCQIAVLSAAAIFILTRPSPSEHRR
jgi:predicted membrane metal-binding protein